jgi:site-specific DNA recombinase
VPGAVHERGDPKRKFTELLKGISFSADVLSWVTRALKESHEDEKKLHDEEIVKLQRDHRRIQERIDAMYLDKLDGRIDANFFDCKASEWRAQQTRIRSNIDAHHAANQSYIQEGIKLLELAQHAARLFESQPAKEKRKLLDFVLSNCTWKEGELVAQYRHPFDILADAVAAQPRVQPAMLPNLDKSEIWLPGMDSNHGSRLSHLTAQIGLREPPVFG